MLLKGKRNRDGEEWYGNHDKGRNKGGKRIHLKTSLNAIAAKIELKRTITVCSICLPRTKS
jgi:hypothetical protein